MEITQNALKQRIQRALKRKDQILRKARGARGLGDYYVLDVNSNAITFSHVDLKYLGRELGVLDGRGI